MLAASHPLRIMLACLLRLLMPGYPRGTHGRDLSSQYQPWRRRAKLSLAANNSTASRSLGYRNNHTQATYNAGGRFLFVDLLCRNLARFAKACRHYILHHAAKAPSSAIVAREGSTKLQQAANTTPRRLDLQQTQSTSPKLQNTARCVTLHYKTNRYTYVGFLLCRTSVQRLCGTVHSLTATLWF